MQKSTPANTPDGICLDSCRPCDYSSSLSLITCDYILIRHERRPCKAGNGCTVRTINGILKPLPYVDRNRKIAALKQPITHKEFLSFQSGRLKAWRESKGISKADAAKMLCVKYSTYFGWESGQFVANANILKRIGIDLIEEFTKEE